MLDPITNITENKEIVVEFEKIDKPVNPGDTNNNNENQEDKPVNPGDTNNNNIKQENKLINAENINDRTTSIDILPKAGKNKIMFLGVIGMLFIGMIFGYKYYKLKRILEK